MDINNISITYKDKNYKLMETQDLISETVEKMRSNKLECNDKTCAEIEDLLVVGCSFHGYLGRYNNLSGDSFIILYKKLIAFAYDKNFIKNEDLEDFDINSRINYEKGLNLYIEDKRANLEKYHTF